MASKPKGKNLAVRLTESQHTAFHRKAKRYGTPSEVLREFIQAFLDDRLVIKPDPRKESLYVN